MSRKPKKGYYVKGEFVPEGSPRDLELKIELKGTSEATRTDQKKHSHALRDLGKELLGCPPSLVRRLELPEALTEAMSVYRSLSDFEAQRRQMQFVAKQMRRLESAQIEAVRLALDEYARSGSISPQDHLVLAQAERWRKELLSTASALQRWIEAHPSTDIQALRSLIRQASKDAQIKDAQQQGQPQSSRAYREIFQIVRTHLQEAQDRHDHNT